MSKLKISKRFVKTHNTYLKPLPQNYYLHLWLVSPAPKDIVRNPPHPLLLVKIISECGSFTCWSWNQKSFMAGLEPWLHQDRGKVGLVYTAPSFMPLSHHPCPFPTEFFHPFSTLLLYIIQGSVCVSSYLLLILLRHRQDIQARHSGQKNLANSKTSGVLWLYCLDWENRGLWVSQWIKHSLF